jgi:putative transcriptional regulator
MPESHTGRLLVATQSLLDPNFAHAVVLLLEHDEDGAFGVVINRPGTVALDEALAAWAGLAAEPAVVFEGGPVQAGGVLALGRRREGSAAGGREVQVIEDVEVVDLAVDPGIASESYRCVRLYAGYAGWGPGQLESELAEGAWFVVDAEPTDVATADPEGLWRVVLTRQGGLFLTVPEDPSQN